MKDKRSRWVRYVWAMGGLCMLAGLFVAAAWNRRPAEPSKPAAAMKPAPSAANSSQESSDALASAKVPLKKVTRVTPVEDGFQHRVPPLRDPAVHRREMNGGTETFRRNFAKDRASFTSLGSDLAVALREIRIGGKLLPASACARGIEPVLGDGDEHEILYPRGAVTEKYVVKGSAVEQVIVLDKSLESLRGGGDLSVTVSLDTTLAPSLEHRETNAGPEAPRDKVEFKLPEGRTAFTYGGAVAIDASGKRRALSYAVGEGHLEMTLDREFLASAEFPLTIDPLIGGWFYIDSTNFVHQELDVAFSAVSNSYLVVYERNVAAGNGDIQCKAVSAVGGVTGALDLDIATGNDSRRPRVAARTGTNEFLVVWQEKSGGQFVIVGARVKIDLGTPSMIGGKITMATYSGKDLINPVVGWSTTKNLWLIVMNLVYSATDFDLYWRIILPTGTLGGSGAIDGTGIHDERPSVTQTAGDIMGVAWTRRTGGGGTPTGDIYGCGFDMGASTVGTIGAISVAVADEQDVRLGSEENVSYAYACWARQFGSVDYETYAVKVTFPPGSPPPVPQLGAVFFPEGSAANHSMRPACALANRSGKERLIVTFGANPTFPPTPGSTDIKAVNYDTATDPPTLLESFDVVAQAYEDEKPSVAINRADLSALVVWDHAFGGGLDLDPLGQRVDLVNADFVVTPASLTTTEGGGTATLFIRLKSKPTGSVTVPISSSNPAEGTVSVSSLQFTPFNWNSFQSVVVTGANDSVTDGNIGYFVVLGTVISGDFDYGGLNPPDVPVTNNDNEPEVRLTLNFNSQEPNLQGAFTITRTGNTNVALTVNYTVSGTATAGTDYNTLPGSLTIPVGQPSASGFLTIIDDLFQEATETVVITLTSSVNYFIVPTLGSITMLIFDDDVADFSISTISGNTSENGDPATFRVHLTCQPAPGMTVTIPLSSSKPTEGNVSPASLNFDQFNWSSDQLVTVTGVNDSITDPGTSYQINLGPTSSGDSFYNNKTPNPVPVINDDNEPEVWLTVTSPNASEPGTNGVFTVNRTGSTAAPLQVNFVVNGTATSGSDFSPLGNTVTIPAGASSQTITVTVLDDFIVEPTETVDLTLSVNPGVYTVVLPWAGTVNISDNDAAGFSVSTISGHTSESLTPATFTVRLTSQPSANVTIPLSSSLSTEGTVSPGSLVFGPGNWNTLQTVTVTGANDLVTDGNKDYSINLGPASSPPATGDPNYHNKTIGPVAVTNDDNEPEVTIVATTSNAVEGGANGVFTVTRTGSTGTTITVNYTVSGTATAGSDYTALSGTLNFSASATSATISVPVINDAIVEAAETVVVTLAAGGSTYTVSSPSQATVTITSEDVANLVVSTPVGTPTEDSGAATFTVKLSSQPSGNVTVTVTSNDTTEGKVSSVAFPTPATSVPLTFTNANWNTTQTVTVTGQNDTITDPAQFFTVGVAVTATADSNYPVGMASAPVNLTCTDNEPEVTVVVTTSAAEPSTNGVFTVSRTGNTGATLTVNYTVGGSAIAGTDYTALSGSVTFAANATTAVITVPILDDAIVENVKTVSVTLSPSVNYSLASPSGAMMTLSDNDVANVQISPISGNTSENLGTAFFTMKLTSQPSGDVTIPVATSNTGEGQVSSAGSPVPGPSLNLVFNAGNWNTLQTVTVTGVNDSVTDPAHSYFINLGPIATGDFNYQTIILAPISVFNDDNEPEVTITATTPSASEPSTNGVFTVTRTGNTTGPLTVNYSVGGTATNATDYAGLGAPVTIPAGSASATIPVTVQDDQIAEGAETVILTLIGGSYTIMTPSSATVTISDNETSGFNVSPITQNTTEGGGTATFTVSLKSQPLATVTIPVATSLSTEGLVSGPGFPIPGPSFNLTFTTGNWSTNQTVTVTGVNDFVTDPAHPYQINLGPSNCPTDSNYHLKPINPVACVNTDNEPELTIAATTPTAVEGGAGGVFTVTRTGDTSAALTVNYTVGGTATAGSDYTTLSGSVVIGVGVLTATIPVAALDDPIVDPAETVVVTLAAGFYTIMAANQATVTITDTDSASLVVSPPVGTPTEDSGTATFTVKLNSQPSGNVTVTVTSNDTTEGKVSSVAFPTPATSVPLTFTNANWNTTQTVTVTGQNDTITDPAQFFTVGVAVTATADSNYPVGMASAPVNLTCTDNEPEVTIVATVSAAAEGGANGLFTVTRTGNTGVALSVNYSIGGTASNSIDYAALSGLALIPANQLSTTIPVTVTNDNFVELLETVILTLSAGPYTIMSPSTATVNITDNDVADFTISPISNPTTEAGGPATFTIRLTSQPTADVTIPVATSNTGEGLVSSAGSPVPGPSLNLVFNGGNWNTDQTVTVTGVNDTATDPAHPYQINLSPTASGDGAYSGRTPPAVLLTNTDNEPEVTIVATTAAASEPSSNGVFTVTRTGNTGAPLTVNYTVTGSATAGSDYTALPGSVTFAANSLTATITVTVVDDALVETQENVTVTLTGGGGSTVMIPSAATVTISDNDNAGFIVSTISQNTTENLGTATFTIRLTSQPAATVTIPVATSLATEGLVSGPGFPVPGPSFNLTFTTGNWNTDQTVTVTGQNDTVTDPDHAYQIDLGPANCPTDSNYHLKPINPVACVNTDNEPEVTIAATTPAAVEGGAGGVFTVSRTGTTGTPITVNYTVGGTATAGSDYTTLSGSVTFSGASATIAVAALDDPIVDPAETVVVTLAAGAYTIMAANQATVTITDTDSASLVVSPPVGTPTEDSGTATFTVKLNSQPSGNVTVTVTSNDTTEGKVSSVAFPTPATSVALTFTNANWNTTQTVTVTGQNDTITDPAQFFTVGVAVTATADSNYPVGMASAPVNLTCTDNEPEVTIVATVSAAAEGGANGLFTVTRTGNTGVALTVNYSIGGSASNGTDYTALTGLATIAANQLSVTIPVTVANDNLVELLETVILTLSAGPYTIMSPSTATVDISDNDVADFAVSPISGTTSEDGGSATFTVRLTSQPTADVTIPLVSSLTTEGTVSPSSLTFTAGNWNTDQTVTVTGQNDTVTDVNHGYQINLGQTASADSNYNAKTPPFVSVTNVDNEPEIRITASIPNAAEGAPVTNGQFTVTRTGDFAAPLVVNLTIAGTARPGAAAGNFAVGDPFDYQTISNTVTIPGGATSVTIPVTVFNDAPAVQESPETVIVTLAAGGGYNIKSPSSGTVNIADDDLPGFTVSAISGNTNENLGTATFTIVLNTQPTGDVIFPVVSSDPAEGTAAPASITFTSVNWNSPRTVTVTGVNDTLTDGPKGYQINLGPSTCPTDILSPYHGMAIPFVSVTNDDNEPEVTIAATIPTAVEGGASGVFTVTRTGSTGTALTVNYTIGGTATNGTDYTALPGSVTFAANLLTATINVVATDDPVIDPAETVTLTLASGTYTIKTLTAVTVTITDNDSASLVVSPPVGTPTEDGGTATFTVKLNSQPSGNVTVTVTSNDTTEGKVSSVAFPTPATTVALTFTNANWNTTQTVIVTGQNDFITDPAQSFTVGVAVTATADSNYPVGMASAAVNLTCTDNEPEVTIVATTAAAVEGGANGVFTVTRTGTPSGPLVVNYTVGGTATSVTDYAALLGSVTIPDTQASATITVTVVNDSSVELPETVIVTLTPNAAYSVKSPSSDTVTIADNDTAGFTFTPITGNTSENGTPVTFTLVLKSQPSADVTIPLASSLTTEGTVSPPSLVFTNANWSTPRTVTVTGVNDTVTDPAHPYQIILGPTSSGDSDYNAKTPTPVDVINDDNEPEVTIVATTPNASEPNVNGVFTVTRTGTPTGALVVNYTVGGTATAGADYTALPLSVTIPNAQASATITVQVQDDSKAEGAETVSVTLSANLGVYTVMPPSTAQVTISDDDAVGFVVSAISGNTNENLGTATFTVRLTSQPGGPVTIPVTTSNTGEGLVSTALFTTPAQTVNLTFTGADWNVNQVVTVTGQNDTVTDPAHPYQINLGPTTCPLDGAYAGQNPGSVSVINVDNEPEVTIVATTPNASEPNTNGVFTITRTGNTGATLTVNYSVAGTATAGSDYTALSGSVTIGASATFATITVPVLNDFVAEGSETVVVTLTPTGSYTVATPSQDTVTIGEDDVAGFSVTALTNNTTENGGTATFKVKLTSQPTADVTIPVATSNTGEGLVSGPGSPIPGPSFNLLFTAANWNTDQTVLVTGVNDASTDPTKNYQINLGLTTSGDTNYQAKNPGSVAAINDDNEPEVTILATSPNASEPNTGGVFTVFRTGNTGASLTVNYTVGGTATAGTDYTALSGSVTFNPSDVFVTISVAVLDDFIVEALETVVVTLTGGGGSTVMTPSVATVNITDNEVPGFGVVVVSNTTTESGGTGSFTVVLNTQPSADVTIPLASSDTGEGTVSTPSLVFTSANWFTPRTVTVTGRNDTVTDPAHPYQIILGPTSSGDSDYNAKTPAPVNMVNTDNEPEVTIVATTPNASEPNVNGVFTVSRTGNTGAALLVSYLVSGTATAGSDYTTLSGTVTIPAPALTATITVPVLDDLLAEVTETVIVTLQLGSYTVSSPSAATVNIADDEASGFIISPISGNTSEGGGAATFTVVLTSQPASGATVTIPVTTSNAGEGLVSGPGSPIPGTTFNLLFTDTDWSVAKTVTVTGVNDFVTDPAHAYQITFGATSSADPDYNNQTPTPVDVVNTDNEPEVTIAATSPNASEPNTVGVFTVTRTGSTGASLTVNYTVSGTATAGSDYAALSGSATIQADSLTTTITVTVLDDFLVEVPETVLVTLTPSGAYTVALPSAATVTIADNDSVGFFVSPISGNTSEGGTPATFTVRLSSQPTADVTIPVASSNTGEGTVLPASLTFTIANWNIDRTVTVTGVNDTATDPAHAYQIVLGPTSSTDGSYNGQTPTPVAVVNDDNEPEVTIVATAPNASEPATNGVFTVFRTGATTGSLVVNYTVGGTATPGIDYTGLPGTVTIPAGSPSVDITVGVLDDPIVELAETVDVTLAAGAYTLMNPSSALVTIADEDQANFLFTPISGNTTENGGTATFTVRLTSQPTADVTIPLASSDTTEGSVAPPSLVFTNADWMTPKTVTVTGLNDTITDGNVPYQIILGPTASADSNYQGKTPTPVNVINNDNEPEVTILATTPNASEPSSNGVFTVSRTGDTTSPLVVSYSVGGTATPGSDFTGLSGTVTIPGGSPSANITVAVQDDVAVEVPETVIVTLTAGAYSVMIPSTATVTINDDDSAGFIVTAISGNTTEGGGPATFTIRLTSQPSALVTIPMASSNTGEGTIALASLQFNSADWSSPKTVIVTGVNDTVTDGNIAYQINLGPTTSGDANYDAKTPPPVLVTNVDNEPEVTIVATTAAASEPSTNGLFTVSRTGSTAAALTLSYSVGGTATGGSDYTALSGSLTIPAGFLTATIPVTVVDDGVVEAAESVLVTLNAGAGYFVMNPAQATVTIADDDASGFAVVPTTGLFTTESGGTATFTVRLTSVPTGDVTIPLATANPAEGLVSSVGSPIPGVSLVLTFTPANWNVPQTVTLTGVNDTNTDGDIPYAIVLGPTGSADTNYNAKTPPSVAATNRDNEPEITIAATTPNASEPSSNGVFTITRTGATASPLSVNYSVSGTATSGSDFTALIGSVVIPGGQASADVVIVPLDDAIVEINETVILTLTPSVNYTVVGILSATVTIGDNDVAGITVRQLGTQTTESGGTATFTIVLDTVPAADVTITLTSSNTAEATASPSSITFTPANALVARTITVSGVPDHVVDGDKPFTIFTNPATSTDPNYNTKDAVDLTFTNKDTDVLGFFISPITGLMTTESAGTATFSVVLTTTPTAVVTLPLTSNNLGEGLLSTVGSPIPGPTVTLTFTVANALTPQVVTITGIDDGAVDGNVAYQILTGAATSSDLNYNGLDPANVSVLNLDNDGPAITINPISGLVTSEFGGTATFDVVLNQAPVADVTIGLSSSNTAEGLISSAGSPVPGSSLTLVFTAADWNVPQTVTVTGLDDAQSDGDIVYKVLTAPATSPDPKYNGLNPPDVNVTNLDDEPAIPPQIILNIGSLSFTASEGTVNPPPQSLAVTNAGNGTLNWSASVDVPWASESPGSGSVSTGADFITVSVNISGLTAGTYNGLLLVDAPGASNTPQSLSITLTVLPPAPTVQITTPNTNPFNSPSNIVQLQGSSLGNATLISWSNAATGQTGTAVGPVDAWVSDIPLTAGDNPITVFAWNSGGAGISLMTVHYDPADATPPVLSITDPSSSSAFSSSTAAITLSGPVSDNVGVAGVTWSNLTTGTAGTATVTTLGGVTQWSAVLSLTNGGNQVQIVARDSAGNSSNVTVTISYSSPADGVPPQINIMQPTTGDFWPATSTPLPMAGTAFDPVGVSKVTWRNFNTGGRGVATGTTTWSCDVPLTLGGNFIAISAVDPSGNESTSTLLVSFKPNSGDKVPPFIMVLSPSQSPVLNLQTTTVSLGGAAADDVALNTVVWSNPATGSSGTANGLASWSTSKIPLIQGVNVVTLAAYDTSGNKTEKQLFVVYTPPPPPPVHIKAGVCGLTGIECLLTLALAWGLRRTVRRTRKGVSR